MAEDLAQISLVSSGNCPGNSETALVNGSAIASTATSGRIHFVVFVATEIVTWVLFLMMVPTVFLEDLVIRHFIIMGQTMEKDVRGTIEEGP